MDIVEFRTLLEQELSWREDELRTLRNALGTAGLTSDDQEYCRTVLVMTYAHFEGFVKQSLGIYVDLVNSKGLKCGDLAEPLAVSTISEEIASLRNPPMSPPSTVDSLALKLQRQAEREVEFVRRVRDNDEDAAALDPEDLTSTDSNLSPAVLRRNLFRLGLDPGFVDEYESSLTFLLRTRNDIAHGGRTVVVPRPRFEAVQADVAKLFSAVPRFLTEACASAAYLLVAT